jgi:hypothetical protein
MERAYIASGRAAVLEDDTWGAPHPKATEAPPRASALARAALEPQASADAGLRIPTTANGFCVDSALEEDGF